MRIAIADNCGLKFCRDLKEHWEKKHEVKYEPGASEFLAQWADLYYVEWMDHNIDYLWQWYRDHPDAKKPKFCVRVIDWDLWCGYVPVSQQYVDFIDYVVTIAPHMYREVQKSADLGDKLHLIRPGVVMDRFTFRDRQGGNKIAMMTGDIWQMKNVMEGLMLIAELDKKYPSKKYELHWRGQYADHARYMKVAVEHFIQSRGLQNRVILYPNVSSINDWLEPMDYILATSIKEAFSYSVAEAMCKGIKPIINNWYGSEEIWPKQYIYNTLSEAMDMIHDDYHSMEYRQYIEEHYPHERAMEEYDRLLGT